MRKRLTIERVRAFAFENKDDGGNILLECWTDFMIQQFIDQGGTLKKLKEMFDSWMAEEHIKDKNGKKNGKK